MYLVLYILNGVPCCQKAADLSEAAEAAECLSRRDAVSVTVLPDPAYDDIGD